MADEKFSQLDDPGIRAFMIEGEKLYPPNAIEYTLPEKRSFYDSYCAHFARPHPPGVATADFSVNGVACRRYVPQTSGNAVLFYIHGGGFVVGGLESHDSVCADLADGAQIVTVAIQYRLAPEYPFPAAFDDCWAVLSHLRKDGRPVVLAGDSAGANLAAALCLKSRDEGLRGIRGQVLIYPGLGGDITKGSYVTQAHAPGLTLKDVLYYEKTYGGLGNKFAWPLRETNYAGLPQAFIVAAGLDPLHDDSIEYADRLNAAGVVADVCEEPLLVHAFLRARYMSKPAAESFKAIIAAIARFAA